MDNNKDLVFNESLSQEFSAKDLNVLVWTNTKTHKNLYMKVGKRNKDSQIELIPLDENELRDLHLEESISETVNAGIFDMDIEESVSDSEPIVKPIKQFRTDDIESMRQAKIMAEQQLTKLEGKNQDDSGLQAAKEILKDTQENLSVELTALGVDTNPEDLKTKTDINRAVSTIHKMRELKEEIKAKTSHQIPSGTVPLSSQTPAQQNQGGYGDYPSMVADLRQRAVRDPIAREALNQLMFKSLKGARETTLPAYQEPQKQMIESDLIEGGKLTAKPDICNLAHNYREKRLRAMAEKGDQSALQILNSGDY